MRNDVAVIAPDQPRGGHGAGICGERDHLALDRPDARPRKVGNLQQPRRPGSGGEDDMIETLHARSGQHAAHAALLLDDAVDPRFSRQRHARAAAGAHQRERQPARIDMRLARRPKRLGHLVGEAGLQPQRGGAVDPLHPRPGRARAFAAERDMQRPALGEAARDRRDALQLGGKGRPGGARAQREGRQRRRRAGHLQPGAEHSARGPGRGPGLRRNGGRIEQRHGAARLRQTPGRAQSRNPRADHRDRQFFEMCHRRPT